ncbi:MAG: NADH-quinone oxidoreductase subunit J [Burkholderiaceae bacterium]
MDLKAGLFYVFSALLLFAAFRVVTARNPVHAVLYLVLAFFQAAVIWMLLRAEFLSIVLVLVYVGAVMVLFVFVVMMLDINMDSVRVGFWRQFPLAAGIGALIALEMAAVLMGGFRISEEPKLMAGAAQAGTQLSNTHELGKLLYTAYVYPVQIAAVILLVAIISAIALTLRGRKNTKQMSPEQQIRVRPRDRLQIVKLPVTRPAQPAVPPEASAAPVEKKP